MSANCQADGQFWNAANGIVVNTQQLTLLCCHVRLDDLGAVVGGVNITTHPTDGRLDSMFQVQVLTTGRTRIRMSAGGAATTRDMTTGTAITANTWAFVAACCGPFNGASQTLRLYTNGASQDFTGTLPTYTGNFISCAIGDGSFAESDHRIAHAAAYSVASLAAADTLVTSLLTTKPSSVGSPIFQFPFETAAPGGFVANGGATIDSAENPPLSGGGGIVNPPIVILL